MATYVRHEVVTRRIEYRVPAPAPWGATFVEVIKAIRQAEHDLRAAQREVGDDTISIVPGDEIVIVSYEIDNQT